ncbi:MAG TPA: SIMPL domain-containing protein [Pyrinomonadaceae bacterium]|jgi:uncharacterized protein YggE
MRITKPIVLTVIFVLTLLSNASAQTNTDRRAVEVTGSAEMLIMPNEFTFKIMLTERIENKQKLTIEMQESNLKNELAKIGVDVQKDLTIFDMTSVYISRKRTRDTLGSKIYSLKLRDLEKIEMLQEIADRLNIASLDLTESTHSELTTFRRETKIEAVKAAKAKAEYMLGAIGERIGKALFVQEIADDANDERLPSNYRSNSNISSNVTTQTYSDSQSNLSFSKIKIRYSVLARFEIQ